MRTPKKSKSAQRSKPRDIDAEIVKAIRAAKFRAAAVTPRSIIHVRESTGMSAAEFAKLLNATPATLRSWEKGSSEPDAAAKKLIQIVYVVSQVVDKIS